MKDVKKNILYNIAYQILAIILPFITAPYLSRVVGASGVGIYSFSYSMALYFTYFTLLGLNNYGNRVIASVQNDYIKRSKVFCEVYSMQLLCFVVSIIAYLSYTFLFSQDKTAAIIMIITVSSAAFDINWFFFGMEKFRLTVIRNTVIKVITVICIFLFVHKKTDIYIYILIMSCGCLTSQLCLWPFMKQMVRLQIPAWKDIKKHFKPNVILFVPVIAVSIYKIMDKIFLGYMSAIEQVGFYENAERIITITVSMITAVGTVMLPRITSLISNGNVKESKYYIDKTMLLVLAYANAVMFGIIAVAKDFSVIYYGKEFAATGVIMCFLAITVIFLGCGNIIRTQYLIPNEKDVVYLTSAILGAIINFIVNLFLIPKYSAIGAAIGTICAEASVCFYQLYAVKKEFELKKYFKWEMIFIVFGIMMYCSIKYMPVPSNAIVALVFHVLCGAIVYIILSGFFIIKIEKISNK